MICPFYDETSHNYMGSKGDSAKINIQNFTGINLGSVRATQINDTTYLAYPDVCRALEITNNHPERLTNRLDKEDEILDKNGVSHDQSYLFIESECHRQIDGTTQSQYQKTMFISESAFYDLTSRSTKEEAILFKHWVNSEVLPSIREATENTGTTKEEITNEYLKDALERGINYLGNKIDNNDANLAGYMNNGFNYFYDKFHTTEFKVDEINNKINTIGSISNEVRNNTGNLDNKINETGRLLMKISFEQGRRNN